MFVIPLSSRKIRQARHGLGIPLGDLRVVETASQKGRGLGLSKKNTQSFDDGGEMEEPNEKNVSNVHKTSQRARDFSFELNCSEVAPPKYVGKKSN